MKLEAIARALAQTPDILERLLAPFPPAIGRWRPAPDDWCINEVLGHLIETDQHAFAARIAAITAQDGVVLAGWSADDAAAARNDRAASLPDLLAAFRAGRQISVDLVRRLDTPRLTNTGVHATAGTLTAADFLYEWPYHDYAHLGQIQTILQQHIWPRFTPEMQRALSG